MAIREIRWQNFRPFRDTDWLEIRPITVIIGVNNSGKTSILDPLLLLKQTLRSKRAQSALVLRGDFVNAGSFSDIAYQHDDTEMVTFGIRYHRRLGPRPELPELGESAPSVCEVAFKATPAPGVVELYRYAVLDQFDRPLVVRTLRTGQRYTLTGLQSWASEADEEILDDLSDQRAREAILKSRPNHFLFDVDSIWNAALAAAAHSSTDTERGEGLREAEPIRLSSFVAKYSSVIDFTYDHIQDDLKDLFFLGPIREEPKRLYQISGDAPPDVGVRGEFSPEILLRGRRKVLFRQVNTWLRRFDLPGQLRADESIDNTFKLVLLRPDIPPTNFADVGFGFSQLLPLIVQGLSAPKDSLLMAEQPEIHLNPRLQARLADFFLEINKRGVNVLLETHSEHLILGIRRLIAEQRLKAENVALYFVEATQAGSKVRESTFSQMGILNWMTGRRASLRTHSERHLPSPQPKHGDVMLADIVVDTNVLGHAQNPNEPRFASSVAFLEALLESSTDICLDGIFAFGGANRSLIGQEYINVVGFGSVSYVALTRLLQSGRIRTISVKVSQDVKKFIEDEIRNVRDRTFVRVTYNSEERCLASHDRIDFPDDVRDRLKRRLDVMIQDAADLLPELRSESAEPGATADPSEIGEADRVSDAAGSMDAADRELDGQAPEEDDSAVTG